MNVGYINKMKIVKASEFGLFLKAAEESQSPETVDLDAKEVLLPRRYVLDSMIVGDEIEVFVGHDSEDRLVASTEFPYAMVGEIEQLEVVQTNATGAFLDWGLPKDLFLPFIEQTRPVKVGDMVIVAVYIDNSGRVAASMRLARHISKEKGTWKQKDEVRAMVIEQTDIGYKVVVNDTHWGILYKDEVFTKLKPGDHIKAYVTKCRPDGKVDLYMQKLGYAATPDIEALILKNLEEDGFIPITDKTPAEEIYRRFQVSKKKYKMAIGGLYKKRKILIDEKGIKLAP